MNDRSDSMLQMSYADSRRFGLRIFRASLPAIDERTLIRELLDQDVDIAIVRVPAGSAPNLDRLGRYGLRPIHADTLVYYSADLGTHSARELRNTDLRFSEAGPDDHAELKELVAVTFAGYRSHYHANPLLSGQDVLAGYEEWAAGYVGNPSSGRRTWVARRDGRLAAFACCAHESKGETCEGVLYGVHPSHAGGGIYGDLIRFTQNHFRRLGYRRMMVSTQIWNVAVQKVWAREGFVLAHAYDTLHINALLAAGTVTVDRDLTFSHEQVERFAQVTGDSNPIHLDESAARQAGFDGRISHGMLSASELSKIFGMETPGNGTLFLRSELAFLRPIYPDRPHRLTVRELPAVTRRISAVATIRDAGGELCLLSYSDLLK